jgi:hypothetical protein
VAYDDGGAASVDATLPAADQGNNAPPGAPGAVQGLAAQPSGNNGAQVSWQPPNGGPAPDQYLVQV